MTEHAQAPESPETQDDKLVVKLTDESGKDHNFVVEDVFEVEVGGKTNEYAVLSILSDQPLTPEEENLALIMRVEYPDGPEGQGHLTQIEDEDEFKIVSEAIYDAYGDENEDEPAQAE